MSIQIVNLYYHNKNRAFFVGVRIEMVLIYGECGTSVMGLPLKWMPGVFLTGIRPHELHFIQL